MFDVLRPPHYLNNFKISLQVTGNGSDVTKELSQFLV
jgi:hypothetical protein